MNKSMENAAQDERQGCIAGRCCMEVIELRGMVQALQKQVSNLAGAIEVLDRTKVSKIALKNFPEEAQMIVRVFNDYFRY